MWCGFKYYLVCRSNEIKEEGKKRNGGQINLKLNRKRALEINFIERKKKQQSNKYKEQKSIPQFY